MSDPQKFSPEDRLGGSGSGLRRYWPVLLVPAIGLIGWFGSQPVTITLLYGATWATYAVGYDMFSGFSGRVNLGYAMFPATAAYVTAVLSARLKIAPALSIPAGIAAALLLAVVVAVAVLARGRSRPLPEQSQWTQVTDFADSAVNPALSADGRMVAFIRGPNTLYGRGEIYVKAFPAGGAEVPVSINETTSERLP